VAFVMALATMSALDSGIEPASDRRSDESENGIPTNDNTVLHSSSDTKTVAQNGPWCPVQHA
jgi:hypothetical protein